MPEREIQIVPKTIKVLPDGTKIVTYSWQGAERARIIEKEVGSGVAEYGGLANVDSIYIGPVI